MSGKNLKIRITMGPSSTVYSDNGSTAALPQTHAQHNPLSPMDAPTKRVVALGASAAMLLGAGWLVFSGNDGANRTAPTAPMATIESIPAIEDTSASLAIPPPLAEAEQHSSSTKAVTATPPAIVAATPATRAATDAKKPAAKTPKAATTAKTNDKLASSSKNVSRAVLTSGIARLEPVDRLGGTLSAKSGKKNLFFFTEIVALKGATVTHRWKHDGQVVGSQRFRIGSNRYRVYSNKAISPDQAGQWQVEVLDSNGKTLQVAQFRFE